MYHLDDEEGDGAVTTEKPAGAPLVTEERTETRLRSRVHDEASIADSFN